MLPDRGGKGANDPKGGNLEPALKSAGKGGNLPPKAEEIEGSVGKGGSSGLLPVLSLGKEGVRLLRGRGKLSPDEGVGAGIRTLGKTNPSPNRENVGGLVDIVADDEDEDVFVWISLILATITALVIVLKLATVAPKYEPNQSSIRTGINFLLWCRR